MPRIKPGMPGYGPKPAQDGKQVIIIDTATDIKLKLLKEQILENVDKKLEETLCVLKIDGGEILAA